MVADFGMGRRRPNFWHRAVLIPLWVIHVLILVQVLFRVYLDSVIEDTWDLREGGWLSLIDDICICACLVLESMEMSAWRKRRLSTTFYLKSQIFKAVFFTWHLSHIFKGSYARTCLVPDLRCADLIVYVVQIFTFHLGLVYALCIWALQRRRRHTIHRQTSQIERDEQWSALVPPENVNLASNPKAKGPLVLRLVQWIHREPKWIATTPVALHKPLGWAFWIARYIAAYIPIVHLVPFSDRFPGEPANILAKSSPAMDDWNYTKAITEPPQSYSDLEVAQIGVTDEETTIDGLSLQTIEGAIAARRNSHPPPIPRRRISSSRLLSPRYLCFLTSSADEPGELAYVTRSVQQWKAKNTNAAGMDYVFISYTRNQFYTQIHNDPSVAHEDVVRRKHFVERDQKTLTQYAMRAAKEAGVPAFWIDFECVKVEHDDPENADVEDGYRICDIVRSAHSLTIVCGPPLNSSLERDQGDTSTRTNWLLDWGTRLWALPEAILCPPEHPIAIYAVGADEPEQIAKRNLPPRLWDDADAVRELIDHYEGSLHLTQLELISIALECLQRRRMERRNAGDVAYALMGLLRLRPKVNKADTDFQAFARLSMANDSDAILERLVCLQPTSMSVEWHDLGDFWDSKLWHIHPAFQIADIGHSNAVVIGDTSGTMIDWSSLKMVDFKQTWRFKRLGWTIIRSITNMAFVSLSLTLVIAFAISPVVARHSNQSYWDLFWEIVPRLAHLWWILVVLAIPVPALLLQSLRSTNTATQARIFGLSGKPVSLGDVEALIFGTSHGRLRWNEDDTSVREEGDERAVFTIIDTLSLTATAFRANKPPAMFFVGGREHGKLRALLCSYDVATRAFVKEAVIRLESEVFGRLRKVERFRFSVQPIPEETTIAPDASPGIIPQRQSTDSDLIDLPEIAEFRTLDDVDDYDDR